MMAVASNPLETFIWGAGGQKMSPEQVARQREIAAALMQGGMDYSPVDHWLQGAARASQGLVGGLKERWAGEAEQREREGFQSQWDSVFGGGSASPIAAALAGGGAGGGDFMDALINSESGGNWNALNSEGYGGRLQFGDARLADAARAGVIPAGVTGAAFSQMSPEQQQAVEAWHFNDIDQQAERLGINKYLGQTIAGVPINQNSIRSMAHLGGIGGVQKFVQSGGQYNPSDSNGTSLSNYGTRFGGMSGGGAPTQVAQAGGGHGVGNPSVAQLLSLAGNEWANPGQSSVVSALLGQAMQQQDPMYQQQLRQGDLDYQRSQLEFEAMMNPPAPAPEYGFTFAPDGSLIRTDKTSGGFDTLGQFASADDGLTDTQRNLMWRAEEAGLVRGTPEYNEFMRSGGQSAGMALTMSPDGTIQFTQGGASGGNLTEGQSKDSVYFTRASGALPVLDELENALLSYGEYAAGALPAGLGNFLQSEDYQVAQNAGKELLASILRKDTGAAVTPSEEALYGDIFLPRPGDKPATLARKRQARALAIEAIAAGMPAQAILNSAQALINAGVEAPNVPSTMQVQGGGVTDPNDIDALLELYK